MGRSQDRQGPVPQETLSALAGYDTPTLANAIEVLDIRPRSDGFTGASIRSIFTDLPPTIGYAVTGRIRSRQASPAPYAPRAWWEHVLTIPSPRFIVFEDLDDPPGLGAFWGEIQANIHRALGCVGVVTNGSVRDLSEVHDLGFGYFAEHVAVSHAYVHLVDFGSPVRVSGLTVRDGDLLMGDRHGVVFIPIDQADALGPVAERLLARERKIIAHCQSDAFNLDDLAALVGA
jgi:4-hydroxy-4-methyl-2-oxoglutarate aldolase